MFDQFTVIIHAFTGKLKTAPTLRKYFWVFLSGGIMALIILSYNAFMSLNFYRQLLERFTPWDSLFLPFLTTVAIAITVYLLMSSITGTILDYISGRDSKTKGHEPMFIATLLLLVGFLCLDIYANLKGVNYASKIFTKEVVANNSTDVFASVNTQIAKQENILNKLLSGGFGGYGWWQDKQYHLNNSGKRFQRSMLADIQQLREQQQMLVSAAIDTHEADQKRFQSEVMVKRSSHIKLVWFAYPLAFLICFIIQHYIEKALEHIQGETHARGNATPSNASASPFSPAQADMAMRLFTVPHATPHVQIPNLTHTEAAFLKKWQEAVDLIMDGYSNKEVMELYEGSQGQIRGTTIQKIKTVLRAKGVLPEYQSV